MNSEPDYHVAETRVVITQRGQRLDATLPWRGAIRIGMPRREST